MNILLHVFFKQDVMFLLLSTLQPPFSIRKSIIFIDENTTKQKRIFSQKNKRKQTIWTEIYCICMLTSMKSTCVRCLGSHSLDNLLFLKRLNRNTCVRFNVSVFKPYKWCLLNPYITLIVWCDIIMRTAVINYGCLFQILKDIELGYLRNGSFS